MASPRVRKQHSTVEGEMLEMLEIFHKVHDAWNGDGRTEDRARRVVRVLKDAGVLSDKRPERWEDFDRYLGLLGEAGASGPDAAGDIVLDTVWQVAGERKKTADAVLTSLRRVYGELERMFKQHPGDHMFGLFPTLPPLPGTTAGKLRHR